MRLALGLRCLRQRIASIVTPGDPALTTPTLTRTSATGAAPEWDTSLGSDIFAGYYYHLELSTTGTKNGDGTYTSPSEVIDYQITASDIAAGTISHAELATAGYTDPTGAWYIHAWFYREDGATSGISAEISGTVTNSVATLEASTGTGKSQYITVTGSPALTGTMNSNPNSPKLVRTETPAAHAKFHFEVKILGISDRVSINGSIVAGCGDGTNDLNALSSYPVPGSTVPGFGVYVTRGLTGTHVNRNGGSASGTALSAAPAVGDAFIFDVDTTASPNTVLIQYDRASDASVITIANLSLSSQVPAAYYANAGGWMNAAAGGASGDSFSVNFGGSSWLVAPQTGYGIYG